jgi:alkylation response protein AidB-like acyl-CoA dehydrogenase
MSFQLPPEAAAWRDRARHFADQELRPFEIHAEMNEGRIPPEDRAAHERAAIAMGLPLMDVPESLGGLALPVLTQVAVTEQLGRITNALGWCYGEAQGWMFEACSEDQIARYVLPLTRGEAYFCYAISEENAGSDPSAIATTAERQGDHYLITGEKWHVTSYNHATTVIVQAKLEDGNHCLFFCPAGHPGLSVKRTPAYSHTYDHHHPILQFDNARIPGRDRIGAEGDGMGFTHSWFRREADDRGALRVRHGAADRGSDRIRQDSHCLGRGHRQLSDDTSDARRLGHGFACRAAHHLRSRRRP